MSMFEIRSISGSNAIQQFSDLLDLCFQLPKGSTYFDDFPIWNPQLGGASVHRVGQFRGNQLVACAGIRIAELKLPKKGKVPIALIGAVATSPSLRRLGLASKLVSHWVEWAQNRGIFAVLLWSSEYELYQKLGFVLTGEQFRIPISELDSFARLNSCLGEVRFGWVSGIFRLLQKRIEGLVLQEEDLIWMQSHKNVKWFYTGSPECPHAYAALGRGIDLGSVVHEWGGELNQLFQLFDWIQKVDSHATLLGSRGVYQRSGIDMGQALSQNSSEFMCMMRVLEPGLNKDMVLPIETWIWGLDAV